MGLFITEGGVAGHMNHLYDNPDLTFREMKQVFLAASNGELKGTEKTDGQNLQLSYDIKTSSARAARNKGNIKDGGMDAAGLAAKFGGRGALETAFTEAFAAFEAAVGRMSIEEREEVFGPNTNVYYNAEVQDPRAANLINYDLPTLTIHRVGHNEFDRETGSATDRDVSKNARKLAAALDRVQGEREDGRFYVQMNAIKKLEALSDDTAANLAIARLEKALSNAGISDNQTVGAYTVSRVAEMVDKRILLPDLVKKELLKRIFKEKGANIRSVLAMVSKEDAGTIEAIRELVADATKLKFNAIAPVEEIVHDFSVEMLRGLHSAFILDNDAEVERLRQETARAITAIENSGSEEAIEILTKQMSKLKDVEGVSTAAEGFVFDYDGVTYKFTGNFAPMNQLLGLFKYGRGNVPPLEKVDEDIDIDIGTDIRRTVAIIPGGFKPPHKAHLAMVMHYANRSDVVYIFISPLPRGAAADEAEVTFSQSKQIWKLYLAAAGLTNVEVIERPSTNNSPVNSAYEFSENKKDEPFLAQVGDRILLGASQKEDDNGVPDWHRFKNADRYVREGAIIGNVEENASPSFFGNLSGTDFRQTLYRGDTEDLKQRFIPNGDASPAGTLPMVDPREVLAVFGIETEEPTMESILTSLVNEIINERKEKKYMEMDGLQDGTVGSDEGEELEEISTAGGHGGQPGSVEGGGRPVDKDEEPSLIREKEVVVERVLNYLLQQKGLQHG